MQQRSTVSGNRAPDTQSVQRQSQIQGNMYNLPHEYDEDEGMQNHTKILLAILIPIIIVGLTFAGLVFGGVIDLSKDEKINDEDDTVAYEQKETDKVFKSGMNHMKVGDYEEAEKVFMELIEEEPDNEEYVMLCQIVRNYNRSMEKIRAKDYEQARSYFDKIPEDYVDYAICDDVELLDSKIEKFEVAHEIFGKVEELMDSSCYEDAKKTIDLIDISYLRPQERAALEEYGERIEEYEEKEEESKKYELTSAKAEEIIERFCIAYVDSVNSGDFSIVSPYIKGNLYTLQKGMVSSLYSQGVEEQFDFLSVVSVQKLSDTKWDVKVSEGETIFYADGETVSKTYNWTYTVELADGEYYLTVIR